MTTSTKSYQDKRHEEISTKGGKGRSSRISPHATYVEEDYSMESTEEEIIPSRRSLNRQSGIHIRPHEAPMRPEIHVPQPNPIRPSSRQYSPINTQPQNTSPQYNNQSDNVQTPSSAATSSRITITMTSITTSSPQNSNTTTYVTTEIAPSDNSNTSESISSESQQSEISTNINPATPVTRITNYFHSQNNMQHQANSVSTSYPVTQNPPDIRLTGHNQTTVTDATNYSHNNKMYYNPQPNIDAYQQTNYPKPVASQAYNTGTFTNPASSFQDIPSTSNNNSSITYMDNTPTIPYHNYSSHYSDPTSHCSQSSTVPYMWSSNNPCSAGPSTSGLQNNGNSFQSNVSESNAPSTCDSECCMGNSKFAGSRPRYYRLPVISSLSTVYDVWNEWNVGLDGNPSVVMMMESYGNKWLLDNSVVLAPRKKVIKEVQRRALEVGLDDALSELERIKGINDLVWLAEKISMEANIS
ncbi:13502_t:CDS:1 [Gigaspora margarita]|uniref:13502_t:CDS:1 n=1 Tax=Gigaspora margarita TaxID=4874 RepID=A0ABN7WQG1_GIGMA|nr:13502_t:CDS:1 [Gigaspora margarita]